MDERFVQGIREFNRGLFFEAHESWEGLWQEYRGDDRTFLQGLIQIAAGFHHLECGNERGAGRQLLRGLLKLEPYAPVHCGADLQGVISGIPPHLAWLGVTPGALPSGTTRPPLPGIEYPFVEHTQPAQNVTTGDDLWRR